MDLIKEWWFLILSFLAASGFIYRADGRSRANEQDIKDTREQMHDAIAKRDKQRQEDLRRQEKSREETNAILREMRGDQRDATRTMQELMATVIKNQHHGD